MILPTHNKTQQHKNLVTFVKTKGQDFSRTIVKFTKDQN